MVSEQGSGHLTRRGAQPRAEAETALSRRIHQESIRRADVHHAVAADAVSTVLLMSTFGV